MCIVGINVVQWENVANTLTKVHTHTQAEKEMYTSLTTTGDQVFPYLAEETNERPKKWFVGPMQQSATITKTNYYKYVRNAAKHSTMLQEYIHKYIHTSNI